MGEIQKRQSKSFDSYLEELDISNLPQEKKDNLAEYAGKKAIDLQHKKEDLRLDHASADKTQDQYLNMLDQQERIVNNNKGVHISYNSMENKTPSGEITSRTTHATAGTGCLLPILVTFLFVLALSSL